VTIDLCRFIPHGSGSCFDNFTTYASTPFSVDDSTLLYYYSGGNGPHNGVTTPSGIHVRDDAIARAEGSVHAIAGLAHPDPAVLSSIVTQPVRIVEGRPSLWLTFRRNAPAAGGHLVTRNAKLTVELRQHGAPLVGFRATEVVFSDRGCTGEMLCRSKIRWGHSLSRLIGQTVEVEITFRGYSIYSLSQE
jgi:hypothetical protein